MEQDILAYVVDIANYIQRVCLLYSQVGTHRPQVPPILRLLLLPPLSPHALLHCSTLLSENL